MASQAAARAGAGRAVIVRSGGSQVVVMLRFASGRHRLGDVEAVSFDLVAAPDGLSPAVPPGRLGGLDDRRLELVPRHQHQLATLDPLVEVARRRLGPVPGRPLEPPGDIRRLALGAGLEPTIVSGLDLGVEVAKRVAEATRTDDIVISVAEDLGFVETLGLEVCVSGGSTVTRSALMRSSRVWRPCPTPVESTGRAAIASAARRPMGWRRPSRAQPGRLPQVGEVHRHESTARRRGVACKAGRSPRSGGWPTDGLGGPAALPWAQRLRAFLPAARKQRDLGAVNPVASQQQLADRRTDALEAGCCGEPADLALSLEEGLLGVLVPRLPPAPPLANELLGEAPGDRGVAAATPEAWPKAAAGAITKISSSRSRRESPRPAGGSVQQRPLSTLLISTLLTCQPSAIAAAAWEASWCR